MFDIGFWELSIIGVVALIVIGPERLPGVARTAGLWVGRMRRFVSTVKADIDRELKADELQKVLRQQADSAGVHEIIEETKEAIEGVGKEATAAADAFDEQPQDYLVKSDKPRYAELKDEDYFEDDETETSVAKVEHSDSSEKKQQENDDRA